MSVEFFFEFASTYSYPAAMRIEEAARTAGATLVWRPFLLGPIFAAQGWNDSPFNLYPAKGRYMWRDLERICADAGLPFRRPSVFPRSGLLAARLACRFAGEPWLPAFVRAVYDANFARDRDVTDRDVIGGLLEALGQPAAERLAAAEGPEAKAALRAQTERATALGIFGAPSFVVGDELFWGNERLEAALALGRPPAGREGVSGALAKGPRGFVVHEGERIYYERYGEGEPLVLTHGMGGSHAVWFQQIPALATRFHVVTWDQRGFGRSTNDTGRPGPASAARDLAALLDALGLPRAHLVGQSMGGFTALHFARAHPGRVASLVLADTSGGLETDALRAGFQAFLRAAAAEAPVERWPITRHPALGDTLGRRDPARAFLYDQLASLNEPPPAAIAGELARTAHPPAALAALGIPVLFVAGADDPIFPAAALEDVAARIPGARFVRLPDAGHSPYFETPDAWNGAVLAFLDALPR